MIGLAREVTRHAGTTIAELAGGGDGDPVTAEHTDNGLAHWDLVFDAAFSEPDAERLVLDDTRRRRRSEIFAMHRSRGPSRRCFGRRRHQARRAAVIEVRSVRGIAQHRLEIETSGGISAVMMKADAPVGGDRRQIVAEGGPRDRTRAVMQLEVGVPRLQFRNHRHDRSDPDSSGDQQMPVGCRLERKVVARHRDVEEVTGPNGVVQIPRTAAARIFAQNGNAIALTLGRIIAQRVLPHEIPEPQVDVGTGGEPWQVAAARIDEFVSVDGFGQIGDRTYAQLHGLGLPELFERRQAFCILRWGYARISQGGGLSWLYSFAASSPATMPRAERSSRSTRSRRTSSRRDRAQLLASYGQAKAFPLTTPTTRMPGYAKPARPSITEPSSASSNSLRGRVPEIIAPTRSIMPW